MTALEDRALKAITRYLTRKGFDILETEWSCPDGESDIVAKDGDSIVFIDVICREPGELGFPEERIDSERRARFERTALAYLAEHDHAEGGLRHDIVSLVTVGENRAMIRHHINVFSTAA